MNYPPLLLALQNPAFYPHAVNAIEIRQTHISWIVLTGEFAYKIKKPVNLGFLDFSSLAQRQQDCLQELSLNRRFAPELYLDVLSIHGTPAQPSWLADTPAIEYVLKLRQFDEQQQWHYLLQHGQLSIAHVEQLGDLLARLHQQSPLSSAALTDISHIQREFDDNFQYLSETEKLRQWRAQQWPHLQPLMQQRVAQGKVRDVHGDLHLGNIVMWQQRVVIFDCLEFDAQLRNIDVMNDIAFTIMDLLQHQQTMLAYRLLNRYLMQTGDYAGLRLLPFYLAYRALVRAKVAAIQQDFITSASYVALVEQFIAPSRPKLLLTCGLSGSGKTWLSQQLQQYLPLIHLRSDVERKRLFGLSSEQAGSSEMYQPENTEQVYQLLLQQAEQILRAGYSVIVDATFLQYKHRRMFVDLAQQLNCSCKILHLSQPLLQLQQRIVARQQQGNDASDATIAVLAQQQLQPFASEEPVVRLEGEYVVADVL